MELDTVRMILPEDSNLILGHAHFIKTVEDLYEVLVGVSPGVRFGIAFSEASQEKLVRTEGNDEALRDAACRNALAIGAGHTFVILIRNAFPINFLNAIKSCQEVCSIHCATANPVEVVVAETNQGRGVLGVIDGNSPSGVEGDDHRRVRREFLRKIGYKL
jgi:hypothetical protein